LFVNSSDESGVVDVWGGEEKTRGVEKTVAVCEGIK
jgi:hypothetical protein